MSLFKIIRCTSQQEREFHEIRMAANPGMRTLAESILHDMSVLDGKSAALLTFISVVLAALIFALDAVEPQTPHFKFIQLGLYVLMFLFALAATIDIRCLYTMGREDFDLHPTVANFEAKMLEEISLRRRRYRIALLIVESGVGLLLGFFVIWLLMTYSGNKI